MARLPEMFRAVSQLHTMRFIPKRKHEDKEEGEPMSKTDSETPNVELPADPQQKAQDEALMFLRMAIRQINSGGYLVTRSAYGTTPIPAGTNKAGLPKYVTGVASIAIGLEYDTGQQPDQGEAQSDQPVEAQA